MCCGIDIVCSKAVEYCAISFCRDGCEELRSILSKKHQDDVCQEREEQIRVKREQQYQQHKGA